MILESATKLWLVFLSDYGHESCFKSSQNYPSLARPKWLARALQVLCTGFAQALHEPCTSLARALHESYTLNIRSDHESNCAISSYFFKIYNSCFQSHCHRGQHAGSCRKISEFNQIITVTWLFFGICVTAKSRTNLPVFLWC